jgi:uncharacterized damage-inducible protein DinB
MYALKLGYDLEAKVRPTPLAIFIFLGLAVAPLSAFAGQDEVPKNIADSVAGALSWSAGQFLAVAEAMPEDKYSFVPSNGDFEGARSFAEQVKHVACANYAFFNEIEGKTPPDHCEKGGSAKAKTKAELIKYLRDSFDYGNHVLSTINAQNALIRVDGPYAGPNTRLGIAVAAVWHVADHYGQVVEYLRMNVIVPPTTKQYGLAVR